MVITIDQWLQPLVNQWPTIGKQPLTIARRVDFDSQRKFTLPQRTKYAAAGWISTKSTPPRGGFRQMDAQSQAP